MATTGNGNIYNSSSSDAFLVGLRNRRISKKLLYIEGKKTHNISKLVALIIISEYCSTCTFFEAKDAVVMEHDCVKNHNDSSKSMENKARISLLIHKYTEGFRIT